jgi:uncharacterized membrane protein
MSMGPIAIKTVAVAWYARKNYPRVLKFMEDAHLLPSSYDQWRARAERLVRQTEASGVRVIKVDVDPEEFVAWAKARGLKADANARVEFANEAAFAPVGEG